MKSLKNVLAAIAFVFAFGAALSTSANSSASATLSTVEGFLPSQCGINPKSCSTIVGSLCTFQGQTLKGQNQITGQCDVPVYRP